MNQIAKGYASAPTTCRWSRTVPLILALTLASLGPAPTAAQEVISGFTPPHSEAEARYEKQFIGLGDPGRILAHQEYLAKSPAEEGTPGEWRRIQYIKAQLESYGLQADIQTFYPYMADSRKVRVALEMVAPKQMSLAVKETKRPWQEDFDDVSVGFNEGTPAADITAEAVYANYGSAADYDVLKEQGVEVEGKIVLVRYGGTQRSEKPYQAYVHHAAGLIMYSDPKDDGFVKGTVYPEGPWRAPDGIQRGTVYRWTLYTGDPLTPGWAATKDAPRIPVDQSSMSQIPPTTPIGYGAAKPLLENLTGPEAPESWQGGLPFKYRLGGPGSTKIHLKIDIEYAPRAAWNVIVEIPGKEHPEEVVVVGSHPDTWAYSAGDNTSGVATQLELAKGLSALLEAGWHPRRTLILGFFGAEERGITGSTEYAEMLSEGMKQVVAFVNSDGTAGPFFNGSAVPSLDGILLDAAKQVEWPGTGGSVYEDWQKRGRGSSPRVGRPGGGTDYMVFLQHFGVPIISVGAGGPGGNYHCACDDLHSLIAFHDPDMLYQTAVSRVIGVLAMRLTGVDVLPYTYSAYAKEVAERLKEFDKGQRTDFGHSVVDISRTVQQAGLWAQAADRYEAAVRDRLAAGADPATLQAMNDVARRAERVLLTARGLPGRRWYTHQIYAPQFFNGFARRDLPGLYDALYVQKNEAEAKTYESDLFDSLVQETALFTDATSR